MSFMVNAEEDAQLVQRCLAGDTAAFRPLVERYQKVLFTVALRMVGDHDEAREATQNAFVRAYQKLSTFSGERKFFSWLYRILVNECLNVRRWHRSLQPIDPTMPGTDDPAGAVHRSELRTRVRVALAQLPRAYREVIVLRHFADMSYREMAEVLSLPEKTVKSRLYSARQRLGALLPGLEGGQ